MIYNHFVKDLNKNSILYKSPTNYIALSGNYWITENTIKILMKLFLYKNGNIDLQDIFEVKLIKSCLDKDGINYFVEPTTEIILPIPDSISDRIASIFNIIRGIVSKFVIYN